MSPRWRLILAAAALGGWLSYLGYAALTKSHGPMVSHIQAAAAKYAVVADVSAGAEGKPSQFVVVAESLGDDVHPPGSRQFVTNISEAQGYDGPGRYLLLLNEDPVVMMLDDGGGKVRPHTIVGQQRSPGNDLAGVGKPLIYRWNDDVRKQVEKLRR